MLQARGTRLRVLCRPALEEQPGKTGGGAAANSLQPGPPGGAMRRPGPGQASDVATLAEAAQRNLQAMMIGATIPRTMCRGP